MMIVICAFSLVFITMARRGKSTNTGEMHPMKWTARHLLVHHLEYLKYVHDSYSSLYTEVSLRSPGFLFKRFPQYQKKVKLKFEVT